MGFQAELRLWVHISRYREIGASASCTVFKLERRGNDRLEQTGSRHAGWMSIARRLITYLPLIASARTMFLSPIIEAFAVFNWANWANCRVAFVFCRLLAPIGCPMSGLVKTKLAGDPLPGFS